MSTTNFNIFHCGTCHFITFSARRDEIVHDGFIFARNVEGYRRTLAQSL